MSCTLLALLQWCTVVRITIAFVVVRTAIPKFVSQPSNMAYIRDNIYLSSAWDELANVLWLPPLSLCGNDRSFCLREAFIVSCLSFTKVLRRPLFKRMEHIYIKGSLSRYIHCYTVPFSYHQIYYQLEHHLSPSIMIFDQHFSFAVTL